MRDALPRLSRDRIGALRYLYDVAPPQSLRLSSEGARSRNRALRSRLMRESVQVVPELFPQLSELVGRIGDVFPAVPCEVFVISDPSLNAWCVTGKGRAPSLIALHSGLVSLLDLEELAFVLGHEIGHALFGHGNLSDREDGGSVHNPAVLAALSRAGEISADRMGRCLTKDAPAAYRAMLKMTAGVAGRHLRPDIGAFLQQLRRAPLDPSRSSSFRTHPLLAVRCRALLWFEMSATWEELHGRADSGALDIADVEARIERDLAHSMGFSHAVSSESALASAGLWASVYLFTMDRRFSTGEQELLRQYYGRDVAGTAIEIAAEKGPEEIWARLRRALEHARLCPQEAREGLWNDLSRVADLADGTDQMREEALLLLGRSLGLPMDGSPSRS